MNNPIIQLTDLTKCYGTKKAVHKLNLHIHAGEIFGLLGPNGAGKTTTILMMLGLTEPTSGTAMVCGYDATRNPLSVKKQVGYLPDNVGFYPDMTAFENLRFIALLNGLHEKEAELEARDLLQTVGLSASANNKTATFSRGMKQRLGLAEVLIKKPKIVILDEPTLGIDPRGVNEFLELIQKLSREQNLTVLMSSHHLHQVQRVCDRVGIFVDGKMMVEGAIDSLAQSLHIREGLKTTIQFANALDYEVVERQLSTIEGLESLAFHDGKLTITSRKDITAQAVRTLVYQQAVIIAVQRDGDSLDAIYSQYFEQSTLRKEKDGK